MPIRSISNTFNRGELDPTLFARDDLDIYDKGARKLRNMIALWTGAARIAPGTIYVDMMVDRENGNAVIQDPLLIKGFDFTYDADAEITYTIIIRKSGTNIAFDIYYADTLQTTVTSTAYLATQIQDIHVAAAHDRVLILHENVQIRQLKRGASHSSWSLTTFSPRVFPTYDFSVIGEATNYQSFTFTLSATSGAITITSSSAVFTANHVGGLFRSLGGTARITAVASATSASATVLDNFTGTTCAGNLSSLAEKLWNSDTTTLPVSANRGWPARGVFYLNRLILGRSLAVKNLVNLSTAGVYDNFDDADLDGLVAFSVTFNGKGEQSVQSIVADDSILFTTANKLFAQSPLVESPITINNVYFAPQSQSPATSIEAASIDNQTLFVSSDRTKVMQAMYSTADGKYITLPATMLSNNIVDFINSNGTWEPPGISTRLYLATQDNGTMLLYSTLQTQNVAGWSLRTTTGKFRQVIGEGRQSHVIVEREINIGASFEQTLDYAFLSDPTFKARYDVTDFFASSPMTSAIGVLENEGDYILIGNQAPFTALDIDFNLLASSDCELQFEYLDNNGFWDVFTPTDNTSGFTVDGTITWTFDDVLNWAPYQVNDIENQYWIRIKRLAETVNTTPVIGQVLINTGNRIYLERQSFDQYMDSTQIVNSDSNGLVTGLTHLAGQQVYAITEDGATIGSSFVNSSGETTVKNVNATLTVGMQYKPELIPMPLYAPTQMGDSLYAEKYVQDLYVDYVDSLYLQAGFRPQLTDIPNMHLGNYTLGQSVPPQTGIYRICPRGDWQPRQEFVITQSQPGPMTIIGVGYNVEVA
ncbi:TPA: hypothetical protein VAH77_000466 [Legionella pneumophila]|nr:hypothetical protein [Legionella pneumophila]